MSRLERGVAFAAMAAVSFIPGCGPDRHDSTPVQVIPQGTLAPSTTINNSPRPVEVTCTNTTDGTTVKILTNTTNEEGQVGPKQQAEADKNASERPGPTIPMQGPCPPGYVVTGQR